MKVDTFMCDVCKTQKKETNCWWRAFVVNGGVMIFTWEGDAVHRDDTIVESDAAHLCGMNCLTQWLSKNLTK